MAREKKYSKRKLRKGYNRTTRQILNNDLAPTYPVGGKFLKVGDSDLLLTKSTWEDRQGRPVYVGTIVKRRGIMKRKVSKASHIIVKPM